MAEKRYVRVLEWKLSDKELGYVPLEHNYSEYETLTLSDILKAEIKDGSLKGLREKMTMAIFENVVWLGYIDNKDKARICADAILTLLQGKE